MSRAAFESAFPGVDVQPVHGDAPYHNMIPTPNGELWSDFELVTLGAIESDLAMAGPAALALAPALPMLVDSIAPMMDQWRAGPPVTGC